MKVLPELATGVFKGFYPFLSFNFGREGKNFFPNYYSLNSSSFFPLGSSWIFYCITVNCWLSLSLFSILIHEWNEVDESWREKSDFKAELYRRNYLKKGGVCTCNDATQALPSFLSSTFHCFTCNDHIQLSSFYGREKDEISLKPTIVFEKTFLGRQAIKKGWREKSEWKGKWGRDWRVKNV